MLNSCLYFELFLLLLLKSFLLVLLGCFDSFGFSLLSSLFSFKFSFLCLCLQFFSFSLSCDSSLSCFFSLNCIIVITFNFLRVPVLWLLLFWMFLFHLNNRLRQLLHMTNRLNRLNWNGLSLRGWERLHWSWSDHILFLFCQLLSHGLSTDSLWNFFVFFIITFKFSHINLLF